MFLDSKTRLNGFDSSCIVELNDVDESIFSVKFQKITAELEISKSSLKCITDDIVHFDISMNNLRTFMQTKHNSILFNFYENGVLFQVTITSKHCISIMKFLESITTISLSN